MKKILAVVMGIGLLVSARPARAAVGVIGKVVWMEASTMPDHFLFTVDTPINGCQGWVFFARTSVQPTDNVKANYAIVMAASTTGKTLSFIYDSTFGNPYAGSGWCLATGLTMR